jgi:hypothetical protein
MLFLITSVVSLVIGFVLGRVWEIRQDIKRQRASDSARQLSARMIVMPYWPTAWLRHATCPHPKTSHRWAEVSRGSLPRGVIRSQYALGFSGLIALID